MDKRHRQDIRLQDWLTHELSKRVRKRDGQGTLQGGPLEGSARQLERVVKGTGWWLSLASLLNIQVEMSPGQLGGIHGPGSQFKESGHNQEDAEVTSRSTRLGREGRGGVLAAPEGRP